MSAPLTAEEGCETS